MTDWEHPQSRANLKELIHALSQFSELRLPKINEISWLKTHNTQIHSQVWQKLQADKQITSVKFFDEFELLGNLISIATVKHGSEIGTSTGNSKAETDGVLVSWDVNAERLSLSYKCSCPGFASTKSSSLLLNPIVPGLGSKIKSAKEPLSVRSARLVHFTDSIPDDHSRVKTCKKERHSKV